MRIRSPRRFVIRLVAFGIATTACTALAQQPSRNTDDLVFGTWQLDLSRSKYIPGPAPRSETRTYERETGGVKATIRRVFADGRTEVVEYTADFDNPYPVTGSAEIDRIQMKRIDHYRADSVLSHAGRVFGVASRVISPDGQTMRITFKREGAELVNNVAYYLREPR